MTRPALGVAAVVVAAFAVYALAGAAIEAPRAFSDELLYLETATSLADGDGLTVRGASYDYGPLYPLAVSPAVRLTADLEGAWAAAKVMNALFLALVAVPVFLLGRRLLEPWPAVAVAGLAVAIPSAMYVSVVMTESLAYLAVAWTLYAVVLALERPTWRRQAGALVALALATGVRTQFAILVLAYVLAIAFVTLVLPARRERPRALVRTFLPTVVVVAVAAGAVLAGALARGGAAVFGGYWSLWRSYEVGELLRWVVYHLANLELYLAVVPLAVAPIVLAGMWRRARAGDEREAAFLAIFASVNAVLLLLVAGFNTTIYAGERLHDRPFFYIVPLWLVLLFVWLRDGLPRPLAATAVGAALAIALPLTLPVSDYVAEEFGLQHNAAATALWNEVAQGLAEVGLSALVALVVLPLLVVLLVVLAPPRLAPVFPLLVLAVLGLGSLAAWASAGRTAAEWAEVLPVGSRAWVDERVPAGAGVTLLTAIGPCSELDATRAPYLTEFFNARVGPVVHLGEEPDGLPAESARVAPDGTVLAEGSRLRPAYVVAPASLGVAGERVAEGTTAPLVVTRVEGAVRLRGDGWRRELERSC